MVKLLDVFFKDYERWYKVVNENDNIYYIKEGSTVITKSIDEGSYHKGILFISNTLADHNNFINRIPKKLVDRYRIDKQKFIITGVAKNITCLSTDKYLDIQKKDLK